METNFFPEIRKVKYKWYKFLFNHFRDISDTKILKIMDYEIKNQKNFILGYTENYDKKLDIIYFFNQNFPAVLFIYYYRWWLLHSWCKKENIKIELKYGKINPNDKSENIFNILNLKLTFKPYPEAEELISIEFEGKKYQTIIDEDLLKISYENSVENALLYLYKENGGKLYEPK